MQINRWSLGIILVVAAAAGAGGMLGSVAVNKFTGTEAFCTNCHSMKIQAADPTYVHSAHMSNSKGIRPSCADCHIPATNWFIETWVHVSHGVHDMIVESTTDFSDPKTWEARRPALEAQARAELKAWDSVTCRGCHDVNGIQPKSPVGQQSHVLARQGTLTCVDCHKNLVHSAGTASIQPVSNAPGN